MARKRKSDKVEEENVVKRVRMQKIPGALENKLIPSIQKRKIEVPAGFFKLHNLVAAVAHCDSGKTNAILNYIYSLVQYGSINRVIIMSPTYDDNAAFNILKVNKDDVYSGRMVLEHGIKCIQEVEKKIKHAGEDYEEYLVYVAAFRAWKNGTANYKQETMVENNLYKPPEYMPAPAILLFLDDLSHSEIYSSSRDNPFNNLVLRHRHIYGIGLSIVMAVQTFNTGIPKALRQNITQFFLWKTHDSSQLDCIYEQVAQGCDKDTFLKVFKIATQENKHDFLTVDLSAKELSMFRKNFDEEIILDTEDVEPES